MVKLLSERMMEAKTEEKVKDIFKTHFNLGEAELGKVDLSFPHICFEAKLPETDMYRMLAQLVLTLHDKRSTMKALPNFIGGFDSVKCGIVAFDELYQELRTDSDFNWNQTPSKVDNKTVAWVKRLTEKKITVYNYKTGESALKNALKKIIGGHGADGNPLVMQITEDNFAFVFWEWEKELGDNIGDLHLRHAREYHIILGDFYLADLFSTNNMSQENVKELKVRRMGDFYISNNPTQGELLFKHFPILNPEKHDAFWRKYKRPPETEYWKAILFWYHKLVPDKDRERKGAFFTPDIWVKKSQDYMAKVFGDAFKEMYIWDCAAGTGNLLNNLPQQPRNIYASTLNDSEVGIMRQKVLTSQDNIFQFDFLNDDFKPARDGGKLPDTLYDIVNDENKRKKLIVYINPPYAEATTAKTVAKTGANKSGVAKNTAVAKKYKGLIGEATNELFAQFLIRIYMEIQNCWIGNFSTLKTLQAGNFEGFRKVFLARLENCFIVPAFSFENVKGKFPIAFQIWNTGIKKPFTKIHADFYNQNDKFIGKKTISYLPNTKSLNEWITNYGGGKQIGLMVSAAPDFQHQYQTTILSVQQKRYCFVISETNLIEFTVYFAVRHAIAATWLNNREQFLYPTTNEKDNTQLYHENIFIFYGDKKFINNCLLLTLFHNQNHISCENDDNHWIPFTEGMAKSKKRFASDFMSRFLTQRGYHDVSKTSEWSAQARAVYDAGLAVWKYYHAQRDANPNASWYDIKAFFKGRNAKGNVNNKSKDSAFNALEGALASALKSLAAEIEPKIYEYGFLAK